MTLELLPDTLSRRWFEFRDEITYNFHIINPKYFRVLS
jgi:hypothetical protein